MKSFTIRIIGGTNTDLLNEMIERYFYLPDDLYYDWRQDEPPFKTTNYDGGFDICFSIPERCDETEFADWAARVHAIMFDDIGYDWWDCSDEERVIYTCNDDHMLIVNSTMCG